MFATGVFIAPDKKLAAQKLLVQITVCQDCSAGKASGGNEAMVQVGHRGSNQRPKPNSRMIRPEWSMSRCACVSGCDKAGVGGRKDVNEQPYNELIVDHSSSCFFFLTILLNSAPIPFQSLPSANTVHSSIITTYSLRLLKQ
jgi:hypothetical protein